MRTAHLSIAYVALSLVAIAAVWSTQPRYLASTELQLAGRTIPSAAAEDNPGSPVEYLSALHDRVTSGRPLLGDSTSTLLRSETADPVDPGALRTESIHFRVQVERRDSAAARTAVNGLVEAYLDDSDRTVSSSPVSAPELEAARIAADEAAAALLGLEADMDVFERDNAAALSGSSELDTRIREQARGESAGLEQQIGALEARRIDLDRALREMQSGSERFGTAGDAPLTIEILPAAQARWAVLRGLHGADSAEATAFGAAMTREQSRLEARYRALATQRDQAETEFERLQRVHPIDHPDVIRLAHELSALDAQADAARVTGLSSNDRIYIENLARERAGIDANISGLRLLLTDLQADLADYESRAEQAPVVEQRYASLQQQLEGVRQRHDQSQARYAALQAVADEARQYRPGQLSVASDTRIERVLISAPAVNAALIALLCVAALILLSRRMELSRRTIDGAASVTRHQGRPPLAEIPVLQGD